MTQAAHTPSKPVNEYLRTRVLTASPEELRLMLLDGAIKFTNQAREGLLNKNHEAVFNGLTSGRNIVTELLTTIRDEPNPTLAEQVRALYAFIYNCPKNKKKMSEHIEDVSVTEYFLKLCPLEIGQSRFLIEYLKDNYE